MIIEYTLGFLFNLINFVISLLPNFSDLGWNINGGLTVLARVLYFFPLDLWIIFLTNVIFWFTADVAWSIVEWVYKKIPGVE